MSKKLIAALFSFGHDIQKREGGKRLIFRHDRKIPDYFSVVGAPSQFTYV